MLELTVSVGGRLPLKTATSNADRIKTATEITVEVCIWESFIRHYIDIGVLKGRLGGLGLHRGNYPKSVVRHAKILLCRIFEYVRELQYITSV